MTLNMTRMNPISIHALREEGDIITDVRLTYSAISIHALREEGDVIPYNNAADASVFLSTPSARRATRTPGKAAGGGRISIHALREEGDQICQPAFFRMEISIHALREEGDLHFVRKRSLAGQFLSTPSARRATAKTERKYSAFVSLYTSLHKLQRGVCKASRKITPLLAQTTVIPVRSIPENHVCCLFAPDVYQKISTLSCANSG